CTDAIEGMIGNKQDTGAVLANDLLGIRISLPVRLEIACLLHRNYMIERKAYVRPGRLEHVTMAVRQNGQLVSLGSKLLERRNNIWKRLQLFHIADKLANLFLRVGDAAAVHNERRRAMPDLAVGRMAAIAQRVDHRVLEVCTAPPG